MAEETTTDRTAFIEALRGRLLGPGLPALCGPWAERLTQRLQELMSGTWAGGSDLRGQVVSCFAQAPDPDMDALFQALRESMSAVANADDVRWVNELTCFAFVRTLGDEVLKAHLPELPSVSGPGSASFPTRDAKLASMAYTTLCTGLRFDGSASGWTGRWIDLGKEFSDSTDLVESILCGLVLHCMPDVQREGQTRRSNPDTPAQEELIGTLRTRWSNWPGGCLPMWWATNCAMRRIWPMPRRG